MLDPVPADFSFPAEERRILEFWKEKEIFRRSIEERKDGERFVFYEGPPTANGIPHPGHVLTRVAKDVFLRYHTMCGRHVPRKAGWDTHGLPVEIEVEKELGVHGKDAIRKFGVEAYTRKCLESVFRYIGEWRRMTERIAFWLDLDSAYATFHESYVESVWWALKRFFDDGLLYQDYKVVWWWPQGGTALSAGEVGQGYKQVDDPSVVAKFPVSGEAGRYLLAWTTTPWTLPSNVALAVAAGEDYVEVRTEEGERLLLARRRLEDLFGDRPPEIVAETKGKDLEGLRYEPLFRYRTPEGGKAYEVSCADFVTLDTGTGIVHLAPAFGEDDFRAAREKGFGFLQLVEPDGTFSADATDFAGRFCKSADRDIVRHLKQRNLVFRESTYRHEYPYCWRAMEDPLIQYARRSWYVRTTKDIAKVIENNGKIRWQPSHIREGRMGDFLRNNVDWALSRERWWGTPLPIWINDETGRAEAVGSCAEILERNPDAFRAFDEAQAKDPALSPHLRVHKPWIDHVTWTRAGEPGVYRRVPEVIDCWFDSGSMPFAQWGYPHRNEEEFRAAYPADFISEAVDQTRGWWNSLLQINTLLFPDVEFPHPFRSCVVLGHITDKAGLKMSKSKRNYEDPMSMIEEYGGDAVRWMLLSAGVPGQNTRFYPGAAKEAVRELLLKLHNVHSFLVTYARIDAWDPAAPRPPLAQRPVLDRWILAELDSAVRDARAAFETLESHSAARRLQSFVDALSNWYVRRSRARFWSPGRSKDKDSAFATLYESLADLSRLLAPFVPYYADSLYRHLVAAHDPERPESVHLAFYPEADDSRRDDALRATMALVRDATALGQRVRAGLQIKVRQPLQQAIVVRAGATPLEAFADAIREELNVRELVFSDDPARYVDFELVPNFRALGPRLGKRMPHVAKALREREGSALYRELEEKGSVTLPADASGEAVALGRDEVEVRLKAKEGFAAAGEGGTVVVLDARITPDLRLEGLAREAIHRIQAERKRQDLPYEARIEIEYQASGDLAAAMEKHAEWIARETLATHLASAPPSGETQKDTIEGDALSFSVLKADS